MKYLELGIVPLRFEIMKRKLLFLQYILKQDKNSMIYRILKATEENPINGDFVITCKKYLETLRFKITFKEIENLTKLQFRKILKERIRNEAFEFLTSWAELGLSPGRDS